ncbi:hypothetical protein B0H13DRAFT_1865799 [Mycena leptocephala]|nr:hypothetical protein B0H13DRAFT_1865799 [Mycena leptocephala]
MAREREYVSLHLPPELWLRIFEFLPWFMIPTIHAVSTIFSALSYGLLFKEFHYHLEPFAGETPIETTTELERFAFCSSENIAPHVRSCFVNLGDTPIVVESPFPVVSACFEAVSRFSNLRYLTCSVRRKRRVEMVALRLDALPRLSSLHIHAEELILSAQSPSVMLKLEDFSYTQFAESNATGTRPSYLPFSTQRLSTGLLFIHNP